MNPSLGVPRRALVMVMVGTLLIGVSPSRAQQLYEASLRALEYSPDPHARSPRLLGMGRLTLADDLHNRITLWDFAGNPAGIAEADSLTTIEYRPTVRSSSTLRDLPGADRVRERQVLAGRHVRQNLEVWNRSPGSPAYGLVADVGMLQVDRPYTAAFERRGKFSVPSLLGAVNGRVPWLKSDRFDFALRAEHALERNDEVYLEFLQLPQGEYVGKETAVITLGDLFTPNRVEASVLRGGAALSMRVVEGTKVAVGYDRVRLKLKSTNAGLRSTSRLDESRPFDVGQATLVGRLGRHLEWGADGQAWRSHSEEFFFWTISAGPTTLPLAGDGKRLDREEAGTALRTRLRWVQGAYELGLAFGTTFRRTNIDPWYPVGPGDLGGFNDFLDQVGVRAGTDTLLLPERVRASQVEERGRRISGGGSWRLPGGRGVVGAEVHAWRLQTDQTSGGQGPRTAGWDVRCGGEYRLTGTLLGRVGGGYGITDRDEFTAGNAFRRAVATSGFGYRAPGSSWSIDAAYVYEWVNPDFADPARLRGNEQHLAAQLRWAF